jgi:hypothetical protein
MNSYISLHVENLRFCIRRINDGEITINELNTIKASAISLYDDLVELTEDLTRNGNNREILDGLNMIGQLNDIFIGIIDSRLRTQLNIGV